MKIVAARWQDVARSIEQAESSELAQEFGEMLVRARLATARAISPEDWSTWNRAAEVERRLEEALTEALAFMKQILPGARPKGTGLQRRWIYRTIERDGIDLLLGFITDSDPNDPSTQPAILGRCCQPRGRRRGHHSGDTRAWWLGGMGLDALDASADARRSCVRLALSSDPGCHVPLRSGS